MSSLSGLATRTARTRIVNLLRIPVPVQASVQDVKSAVTQQVDDKLSSSCFTNIYTVCGWSRTLRKQGGGKFCFISLNDGSSVANLQVIVHDTIPNFSDLLKRAGVGASLRIVGQLVPSPAAGQSMELVCSDPSVHHVTVYGGTDTSKYPLSKKHHSKEFLREIAHLRPRSSLFGAATRVRSNLAIAIHQFFYDNGYLYVHTPIITCSDCEGAGEMFQVSTLLPIQKNTLSSVPVLKNQEIDYSKDFFGKPAFLTVSGQLDVEAFCCGLADVYTFGPTFRAENSHTSRHLAEFWMVEPEIAFADIHDCMDCAEAIVKFCLSWLLKNCRGDLEWFDANQQNGLVAFLQEISEISFARITYTEGIEMLKQHQHEFEIIIEWGMDLTSELEKYLCESIFKKPVVVFDYPKDLKSFYMRLNDDGKTVAAMDLLVPKIGELVGGSQREERLDHLDAMLDEKKLNSKDYWWYRELRKYGSIPHSGFGLGFERFVMLATGLDNIRDVIPFPRYPGHADF
ncbi:asparaginyl-tRna synthetase (NOB+tRna synthase) [Cardiosporidium cionae]|uniref:asparagine--tRNA ligase n=1 Tax=Cardiosporidium cionae TaxID=476202 RepID=A0ABQ7JA82_9APIC|nr:asparaginyl-tRna synthetase (NOB+tRna synthase) [Cardiosporidium cionae]|eukprot:KAF8820910.1 asparaginyl-tRna synthetase (NOB+tRna synthase) [Cardiosporidium cionae]